MMKVDKYFIDQCSKLTMLQQNWRPRPGDTYLSNGSEDEVNMITSNTYVKSDNDVWIPTLGDLVTYNHTYNTLSFTTWMQSVSQSDPNLSIYSLFLMYYAKESHQVLWDQEDKHWRKVPVQT